MRPQELLKQSVNDFDRWSSHRERELYLEQEAALKQRAATVMDDLFLKAAEFYTTDTPEHGHWYVREGGYKIWHGTRDVKVSHRGRPFERVEATRRVVHIEADAEEDFQEHFQASEGNSVRRRFLLGTVDERYGSKGRAWSERTPAVGIDVLTQLVVQPNTPEAEQQEQEGPLFGTSPFLLNREFMERLDDRNAVLTDDTELGGDYFGLQPIVEVRYDSPFEMLTGIHAVLDDIEREVDAMMSRTVKLSSGLLVPAGSEIDR